MLVKTEPQQLCSALLEEMLSDSGISVIIVGPPSCLRTQYFRAKKSGLLDRVFLFEINEISFVTHSHVTDLLFFTQKLLNKRPDVQGLLVYTACGDVISGTNYKKLTASIEKDYQVPVRVLPRGPLANRIKGTRERMLDTLKEIKAYLSEKENINQDQRAKKDLPPLASDYAGVAATLYDYQSFDILYSPGCCHTVIREIDEHRDLVPASLYTTKLKDVHVACGSIGTIVNELQKKDLSNIDFVSLIGTFITDATGVNLKKEAMNIQKICHKDTMFFSCNGFNAYPSGIAEAFKKLGSFYSNRNPVHNDKILIQIIGYHPMIHGDQKMVYELKECLAHDEAEISIFGVSGKDNKEIVLSSKSDINIVISQEAFLLAEDIHAEYDIPYIATIPLGISAMAALLFEITKSTGLDYTEKIIAWKKNKKSAREKITKKIVIFGEPFMSVAVMEMLKADYDAEDITVLSYFDKNGKDRKLFSDTKYNSVIFTKDVDLIAETIKKAEIVIADPICKEWKNDGAVFIPLPYPGLSGKFHLHHNRLFMDYFSHSCFYF